MNFKQFEKYVRGKLREQGWKLKFSNLKDYGGIADPYKRLLTIRKGTPKVCFAILLHEYSHFIFHIENLVDSNIELVYRNILEDYRANEIDLPLKQARKCFNKILADERRCEIRALKIADELNLKIDRSDYLRRANHNLWEYSIHFKHHEVVDSKFLHKMRKRFPLEIHPARYYTDPDNLL